MNTLKKDWKHDLGIGHVLQARELDHLSNTLGVCLPDDRTNPAEARLLRTAAVWLRGAKWGWW